MTSRSSFLRPVLALGVLVLAACAQPSPDVAAAVDAGAAGPDHGKYALKIQFVRGKLEETPCDKRLALEMVDWLNKAGDWDGTTAFARSFEQRCGDFPRLLWGAVYANEQAGRWDEAATFATRLLVDDPADSDFWWWRGRAHAEAGRLAAAEADFRQSMANRANGFAAFRFSKYLGEKKPCEAAFAIQRWIEHGQRVEDWAAQKRSDHWVAGSCAGLEGKGSTTLTRKKGSPVLEAKVDVDGQSTKMIVNESAAWLTLSKDLAEKAGVIAKDDLPPILLFGQQVPAKAGVAKKVSVGRAAAVDVPVAVVDAIPGGAAGVLGQSFLWRFRTEDKGTALQLRSR